MLSMILESNYVDAKLYGLFYSLGADASSLSSIGHHLSGKELLALPDILQEHVTDSLKKTRLDLKAIGDAQTTIGEVQSPLQSLEQHEVASSLRQRLDLGKHLRLHGYMFIKAFIKFPTQKLLDFYNKQPLQTVLSNSLA